MKNIWNVVERHVEYYVNDVPLCFIQCVLHTWPMLVAAATAALGATLIPLKLRHSRSKLLMAVSVGFTALPWCTFPSFNVKLTRDVEMKLHRI